jgi:hypothetical protein
MTDENIVFLVDPVDLLPNLAGYRQQAKDDGTSLGEFRLPFHALEPIGYGFCVLAGIESRDSEETLSLSAESGARSDHYLDIV